MLLVWRLATRRQAVGSQNSGCGHCVRGAHGGRVGFARRNGEAERLEGVWRLAARDGCTKR